MVWTCSKDLIGVPLRMSLRSFSTGDYRKTKNNLGVLVRKHDYCLVDGGNDKELNGIKRGFI